MKIFISIILVSSLLMVTCVFAEDSSMSKEEWLEKIGTVEPKPIDQLLLFLGIQGFATFGGFDSDSFWFCKDSQELKTISIGIFLTPLIYHYFFESKETKEKKKIYIELLRQGHREGKSFSYGRSPLGFKNKIIFNCFSTDISMAEMEDYSNYIGYISSYRPMMGQNIRVYYGIFSQLLIGIGAGFIKSNDKPNSTTSYDLRLIPLEISGLLYVATIKRKLDILLGGCINYNSIELTEKTSNVTTLSWKDNKQGNELFIRGQYWLMNNWSMCLDMGYRSIEPSITPLIDGGGENITINFSGITSKISFGFLF